MPLILTRLDSSAIPVEVDDIGIDVVSGLTTASIEKLPVLQGRQSIPLAELFSVEGTATSDSTIIWRGDLAAVKGIARGMLRGRMEVEGSAGMHVAAEMRGGEVLVQGDVGDWAGAEMRGGRLTIAGNAGKCLGGAYRGSLKGMTNGEILVHGDCGDEAGQLMRRGLIAISGRSGMGVGYGLLAGTIVLGNEAGPMLGAGMKRGTIISSGKPMSLLPSFRESQKCDPPFIGVLVRHLQSLGMASFEVLAGRNFQRYWGDFVESGRGEILFPAG